MIVAPNAKLLQTRLDAERKFLFDGHAIVTAETFASRQLPIWLKLIARTIRSYF